MGIIWMIQNSVFQRVWKVIPHKVHPQHNVIVLHVKKLYKTCSSVWNCCYMRFNPSTRYYMTGFPLLMIFSKAKHSSTVDPTEDLLADMAVTNTHLFIFGSYLSNIKICFDNFLEIENVSKFNMNKSILPFHRI